MNCQKCGYPLLPNSPVCPSCGLDNSGLNTESINAANNENLENGVSQPNDFIELDDEENVTITATMEPPKLEVENENLVSGVGDLANEESVSTYAPEAREEAAVNEEKTRMLEEESVDIAIPSVQGPASSVDMPADGSAPEVSENKETVGETTEAIKLENPGKKAKFKFAIPKGSKNVPKTLMIIVAVIFLVIGVLLGKMFFSKNYCTTTTKKSVVSSKTKYVSDGKNNITNVGNITFKIPEQYNYDKKESGLLIYNESDTFRIYMKSVKGSYANISGAKNSIRETLKSNSITVNNMRELNALDVEFTVFETTIKMTPTMIAFAAASETEVFYLEIVTSTNTYDYDVLDVAADIIKNITFTEVESTMEKVDIVDLSEVTFKAAEEYTNFVANNN